jgi:hypothetical protein
MWDTLSLLRGISAQLEPLDGSCWVGVAAASESVCHVTDCTAGHNLLEAQEQLEETTSCGDVI